MTALHPRYRILLRIRIAILGVALLVPALAAEAHPAVRALLPFGVVIGVAVALVLFAILWTAPRRYASWGYVMDEDELSVRSGRWVQRLTLVPFGRVQHIDVRQGPLARALGLSTLVLHTAGTHNEAVKLPGLLAATAEEMRDHVRARIRQDLA